jgi:hypothetical protein
VVVSTVSDPRVDGMSFAELMQFTHDNGGHGYPGATVSSVPALPTPLYFNSHVQPDPTQPNTSTDGGVLWSNVPPGTYTFSASSPTATFASFTATCVGNRLINASPPLGLHGIS